MSAGANKRQGRRIWTAAARARIVAESSVPGAMINVVARRHGINPSQLSQWRRDQLQTGAAPDAQSSTAFVPVMLADAPVAPAVLDRVAHARAEMGEIEITRGLVVVRVRGAVDPALLVIVLQALAGPS